ncbi:DivIVA domain-containing protein [Arthrobacter sp. SX1312]|uniref:DivIVA domain-containing protein n=1 Tax=Arthrobacter sp. SX1312 TaxID=2058896 RepID=UPI000CE538F2|nr:DivIVA domain-containing protein [Arthrobacter sp. SX1312]
MTIFLVILAVLLVGGTAVLAAGPRLPALLRRPGVALGAGSRQAGGRPADDSGRGGPSRPDGLGLVEPVASLPPVLLPEHPSAPDVDAVRFGLGLRGYRMDQVDEVLDRLAAALAERDAVIGELRSRLAAQDVRR